MTDKLRAAAEMALKAMQDIIHWYSERDENDEVLPPYNQTPEVFEAIQAVEALRQALAEPDTDAVAELRNQSYELIDKFLRNNLDDEWYPTYSNALERIYHAPYTPPKRKWVGLTDGEITEASKFNVEGNHMLPHSFARAIEAKLKQKNTCGKKPNYVQVGQVVQAFGDLTAVEIPEMPPAGTKLYVATDDMSEKRVSF